MGSTNSQFSTWSSTTSSPHLSYHPALPNQDSQERRALQAELVALRTELAALRDGRTGAPMGMPGGRPQNICENSVSNRSVGEACFMTHEEDLEWEQNGQQRWRMEAPQGEEVEEPMESCGCSTLDQLHEAALIVQTRY